MKRTLFLWMFLLAVGSGTIHAQVKNLIIKAIDGSECVKELSTVQQFSFSEGNLMLKYFSGTSDAFDLSTIRTLYFKSSSNGIDHPSLVTGSAGISVYPNPAGDVIYIKNIPDGISAVTIYRMDGTLMVNTTVVSDPGAIMINNLEKGLYFLRVNSKSFKIIKL
jgi:hypothetical protein